MSKVSMQDIPSSIHELSSFAVSNEIFGFGVHRLPSEVPRPIELSEYDYNLLTKVGLPSFVAPHLCLGKVGEWLPKFEHWSWRKDHPNIASEFWPKIVLGVSDYGPVFSINGEVITVEDEKNTLILVNSRLDYFIFSLVFFATGIEIAANSDVNLARIENDEQIILSREIYSEIETRILAIDPLALAANAFWRLNLDRLVLGKLME